MTSPDLFLRPRWPALDEPLKVTFPDAPKPAAAEFDSFQSTLVNPAKDRPSRDSHRFANFAQLHKLFHDALFMIHYALLCMILHHLSRCS